MVGRNTDSVYQYNLSTAYDLSTASYVSKSLSVASQDTNPNSIDFSPDGLSIFVGGSSSTTVYKYSLGTAWDISTASYSNESYATTSQAESIASFKLSSDGLKGYMLGSNTGVYEVFQYSTVLNTAELDLSTGSVFEITPTSDIQVSLTNPADSGTVSGATLLLDGGGSAGYDFENFSYTGVNLDVSSEDSSPRNITFNTDGTKFFMLGGGGDKVYQYSLSVAYDLSTASYDSVSLDVSSPAAAPNFLAFNTSGTKLYVLGFNDDTLYQYSLSTGFDLSTASYDSVSLDVGSQDSTPLAFNFNPDGTKMYVSGGTGDEINQYSLSTAYDLSTASFDSVTLSVSAQDTSPRGLTFNSDGTKLYLAGSENDSIYQYSLSTGYDLSTASYDSVSYDVSGQDTTPSGLVFNSDGTKLYLTGNGSDTIYQYSTATPATITYDPAIQWSGGTAPTSPAIGETDVLTFNTTDGGTTYNAALAIDGAS
jgi:sugar lactone lactonase YvrE